MAGNKDNRRKGLGGDFMVIEDTVRRLLGRELVMMHGTQGG